MNTSVHSPKSESLIAQEMLTETANKLSVRIGNDFGENKYWCWNRGIKDLFGWWGRVNIKEFREPDEAALKELLAVVSEEHYPKQLTFADEDVYAGFKEDLEAMGLQAVKLQKGMLYVYAEHENEPAAQFFSIQPGQVIEIGPERLAEFAETDDIGFGRPSSTLQTSELILAEDTAHFYAYEVDGKIVATTILCFREDGTNATLFDVTTLPEYRGRGYASALVLRCIEEGRKAGLPLISLQASVYGEPVYKKLGFRVVSQIRNYKA